MYSVCLFLIDDVHCKNCWLMGSRTGIRTHMVLLYLMVEQSYGIARLSTICSNVVDPIYDNLKRRKLDVGGDQC